MPGEVGYKKPPVHTRFQKGRSGNPGGRPGPRRDMERCFGRAVEAALVLSPQALMDSRPASEFSRMAVELVRRATRSDVAALRIVLSFLPERGEWVRRARLPAGMLDELMRAYLTEQARASGLRQAQFEKESQGIIARQKAQDTVRQIQGVALRQAENAAGACRKRVQGFMGETASRLAAESQGFSQHLRRLHLTKCRALRDRRRVSAPQPP